MSDVTRLLSALDAGDPHAAEQLLPLVYAELRKLAGAQMAGARPGQTLDATALVHQAYLRLAGGQSFDSRSHFFAAAARAMRRILIDHARRKGRLKRGGNRQRAVVELDALAAELPDEELLDLHDALERFAAYNPVRSAPMGAGSSPEVTTGPFGCATCGSRRSSTWRGTTRGASSQLKRSRSTTCHNHRIRGQ